MGSEISVRHIAFQFGAGNFIGTEMGGHIPLVCRPGQPTTVIFKIDGDVHLCCRFKRTVHTVALARCYRIGYRPGIYRCSIFCFICICSCCFSCGLVCQFLFLFLFFKLCQPLCFLLFRCFNFPADNSLQRLLQFCRCFSFSFSWAAISFSRPFSSFTTWSFSFLSSCKTASCLPWSCSEVLFSDLLAFSVLICCASNCWVC